LLGPLLYLLVKDHSDIRASSLKSIGKHLALPVLSVIAMSPFYLMANSEKVILIQQLYQKGPSPIFMVLAIATAASLLFYIALVMKRQPNFFEFKSNENRGLFITFLVTNIGFISLTLFGTLSSFYYMELINGCNIVYSIGAIIVFCINLRHPEFFSNWTKEVVKEQERKNSYLKNIDTESMLDNIRDRMIKEQLFINPDLSLESLADLVGLHRNQLSELLNVHVKKNFRQFLTEFRVEASKELLIKEDWKTVQAVGMDCGFNSSALFNRHFKKIVGITPSQFRKQQQK